MAGAGFWGPLLNQKNSVWAKWHHFSSVASETSHIWIDLLVLIFVTRKAVALLSNILSCWADQYGSIDTSNNTSDHFMAEYIEAAICCPVLPPQNLTK